MSETPDIPALEARPDLEAGSVFRHQLVIFGGWARDLGASSTLGHLLQECETPRPVTAPTVRASMTLRKAVKRTLEMLRERDLRPICPDTSCPECRPEFTEKLQFWRQVLTAWLSAWLSNLFFFYIVAVFIICSAQLYNLSFLYTITKYKFGLEIPMFVFFICFKLNEETESFSLRKEH